MFISQGDHILFFGDSITDAGRQGQQNSDGCMGRGYASMVQAFLDARHPRLGLRFTNQGISGNRVYDLEKRLESDVLAARPDIVTILIGINDTWRRYDSGLPSPLDEFEASYRRVCESIVSKGSKLVILEPFLLPVPADRASWREDLNPRIDVIRKLAVEMKLPYLALDGIFAAAATARAPAFWAPDGVHPSPAGHALIADAVINLLSGQ